jgi:hypothetical protein
LKSLAFAGLRQFCLPKAFETRPAWSYWYLPMKPLFFVFGLALLMALPLSAQTPNPQEAAQASAETWLEMIDAGKYAEAWQASAPILQKAITLEKWVESLTAIRTPFGKTESRKLKSAKYTQTLPGAPDGEYVVMQYETVYEKKKSSVETITPMKDQDGKWKVSGYYIK